MLMLPLPVRARLFLDISPSCQYGPILEPWCDLIVVGARRRHVWATSRFPGQAHRFLDLSLSRQRGAILALWWKQKNPLVSFLVCHGYKDGKVPGGLLSQGLSVYPVDFFGHPLIIPIRMCINTLNYSSTVFSHLRQKHSPSAWEKTCQLLF